MPYRRIILPRPIDDHDALELWFYDRDWYLKGVFPHDPSTDQPFEISWIRPSRDTLVHYIDDHVSGQAYLVVNGRNLDATIAELNAAFEHVDPQDVLEAEHDSPTDRATQAVRAALLASWPEHRAAVWRILRQHASDPEPEVRKAAAVGMAYTESGDWIPLLDEMARTDTDEEVRREAKRLGDGLSLHAR